MLIINLSYVMKHNVNLNLKSIINDNNLSTNEKVILTEKLLNTAKKFNLINDQQVLVLLDLLLEYNTYFDTRENLLDMYIERIDAFF